MEKKIICIFVSMLMFATVFTVAGTKNINETNEITIASQSNQAEPLLNPGDILIDFDAMTAHGNGGNLGAEWDGQYFWSTGCAAGPAAPAPARGSRRHPASTCGRRSSPSTGPAATTRMLRSRAWSKYSGTV